MPWDRLLKAFDLTPEPYPPDQRHMAANEMRISFRQLDSQFYTWVIANRVDLTFNIIIRYLNLHSTDQSHQRKPHRRLIIIDILHCLGDPESNVDVRRIILDFTERANFADVLSKLVSKSSLVLHWQTLRLLDAQYPCVSLRTRFVELLLKFVDPPICRRLCMADKRIYSGNVP
jgi:hypothetical protein